MTAFETRARSSAVRGSTASTLIDSPTATSKRNSRVPFRFGELDGVAGAANRGVAACGPGATLAEERLWGVGGFGTCLAVGSILGGG